MEQRDRPFPEHLRVSGRVLQEFRDGARATVVDRHQVVRADEEVHVVRGEPLLVGLEPDAVKDGVEIAVVGFDLGEMQVLASVLDRQRVKRERVAQNE